MCCRLGRTYRVWHDWVASAHANGRQENTVTLLGQGRTCDVYDLGDDTVLRARRDRRSIEHEALVMRHVHNHGFPCPRVHRAAGAEMVLDRVHGPTMTDDLMREPTDDRARAAAIALAGLHDRLHTVPPLDGHDGRILHLDLHPDNVVVTGAGPVLIDWTNADTGPAEVDIAMTWVILEPYARTVLPVRWLCEAFLEAAGQALARRGLDRAAGRRLADPNLTDNERTAVRALLDREHGADWNA